MMRGAERRRAQVREALPFIAEVHQVVNGGLQHTNVTNQAGLRLGYVVLLPLMIGLARSGLAAGNCVPQA